MPVSASYKASTDVLTVVFDQVLRPGSTAAANWGGCLALAPRSTVQGLAPGTAQGYRVSVPCFRGAICFGADRCDYFAAPADVQGRTGVAAAAFLGFPCTVVP